MDRVLVTGALGFVGRGLLLRLLEDSPIVLRGAARGPVNGMPEGVDPVVIPDLAEEIDWGQVLDGIEGIVHTAARVHVFRDPTDDPIAAYRKVNVAATLRLAQQAAEAGVRRLIFISSIGVNGSRTQDTPFTVEDDPAPESPYARSKHEAEIGLREIAEGSDLDVVIVRPPLVYGQGAPGNFDRLLRILRTGLPVPLGAVRNVRSFVALENLVDLVVTCLDHPAAANQTFLVSDDDDLSTTEFVQRILKALGKRTRLVPIPSQVLRFGASLLGKGDQIGSLCDSLQIDIGKTRRLLGWAPTITVDEALRKAVRAPLS